MKISETDYLNQAKTDLTTPAPDYELGLRDQVKKYLPIYQLVMADPNREGGLYWNTEKGRFVRLDRTPQTTINQSPENND